MSDKESFIIKIYEQLHNSLIYQLINNKAIHQIVKL